MPTLKLSEWIQQCQELGGYWYVKRLSGNDTQATGSHQAGPYVPNYIAFQIFGELNVPDQENPRITFQAVSGSHEHTAHPNIIWYNNQIRGGTRNEIRITRLGGFASPLLDPENTGSIALLFFTDENGNRECRYWVCRDAVEEDVAEIFAGPIEPGIPWFSATPGNNLQDVAAADGVCRLTADQMPAEWMDRFPTPQEVLDKAISLQSFKDLEVDMRLIRRRDCEYNVFLSVENVVEMPVIRNGFDSIDPFVSRAQTILQRRKARSGRSLELHMKVIFEEEVVNCQFQAHTEANNRPDFISPSQEAYNNPKFPDERLRMLAVKTTMKERWRQILEEANRIPIKHLLTLQEGVSEQQFDQMREAGVRLVVPKSLHTSYPKSIRQEIMTLGDMVEELRGL